MIAGLDHIAIQVSDAAAAVSNYTALLGRAEVAGRLQLDNMALAVASSELPGEATAALRLVLATADLEATTRRLARRALPGIFDPATRRLDLDPAATHGVPIGVTASQPFVRDPAHDIAGLDHVVVRTPDPDRAVALYGGRLGLDLRLDRTHTAYGSRMLFFVLGGLVVEVTHDLKQGIGSGPDSVRGLAWRARDIDLAHRRMQAAGVATSEIRDGRRQGSRVFTVKSHTAGVPTLVIGGAGLDRP